MFKNLLIEKASNLEFLIRVLSYSVLLFLVKLIWLTLE